MFNYFNVVERGLMAFNVEGLMALMFLTLGIKDPTDTNLFILWHLHRRLSNTEKINFFLHYSSA